MMLGVYLATIEYVEKGHVVYRKGEAHVFPFLFDENPR
jgi:hypothetical protein